MFNKDKYNALPAKIKAIIDNGVEAASQDLVWKAIDRYSADYVELQKMGVKFYKTPTRSCRRSSPRTTAAAAKKARATRSSRRSRRRRRSSPSAR
jgi:TRAP-type mannitol/chloroaromatic compound transport system substrate-binding protein